MDEDRDKVLIAKAVVALRENIVAHCEYVKLQAKITREKYLALVGNSFTEAQAIELCKQ